MNKHRWTYQKFEWTDLDKASRSLFESIELGVMPLRRQVAHLMEAQLTTAQINKIFADAEQISRDKNMQTGFGKAVNLPKNTLLTVNRVLGNFGKKLQDSVPVAAADRKFDQLRSAIKNAVGTTAAGRKTLSYVDALGAAAREHPVWQGAIIGLLTAVSSLVIGPASVPVVAFVLKGAAELVKGEKLSTAIGKGVYAGALGYIGAQVAGALMDWAENVHIADIKPVGPSQLGFRTITFGQTSITPAGDGMEWVRWFRLSNVTVDQATQSAISDTILRMGSGDLGAYDELVGIARRVVSTEYLADLKRQVDAATAAKISNDDFVSSVRAIKNFVVAAAAGGGAAAAGAGERRPPMQENSMENRDGMAIMEGLWADLTLKFGAGRLNKAWQEAGRPTDSIEIAQMLASMGMEKDDIRQLISNAGLSAEDVEDTMNGLMMTVDPEAEVPFKSGIADLDKTAARIFATKGKDAFVAYWENKVRELETQMQGEPPNEPVGANKADWPTLRREIFAAMKNKDRANLRKMIGQLTDLTGPQKDILLTNLRASGLDQNTQMQLRKLISSAAISEQHFMEMSDWMNRNKLTWKDLGFGHVYREPRTETVILL